MDVALNELKLTKITEDVAETIIISTNFSDVTIVRDSKCKEVKTCLKAKARQEEYSKIEREDRKRRFSAELAESELIIENFFCDTSCILNSELLVMIPNESKVKEIIVKTTSGDICLDSIYKKLTLTTGSGNVYLRAVFNSEGTKTMRYGEWPLRHSELECRDCNAQINTQTGDIWLELYELPREIIFNDALDSILIRHYKKRYEKDWHGFSANISTKSGCLRHEGYICR